jgi:hypothetical protein
MFIAPGVFAQVQPRFIRARMVFEAREKQSKMYNWKAFVVAQVIAELPWMVLAGTLFFLLWYFVSLRCPLAPLVDRPQRCADSIASSLSGRLPRRHLDGRSARRSDVRNDDQ